MTRSHSGATVPRTAEKALEVRNLPGPFQRGVRDLNPFPLVRGGINSAFGGAGFAPTGLEVQESQPRRALSGESAGRGDVAPVSLRAGAMDVGAPSGGELFQRFCRLRQMAGVA